jgi:hypothetical protein
VFEDVKGGRRRGKTGRSSRPALVSPELYSKEPRGIAAESGQAIGIGDDREHYRRRKSLAPIERIVGLAFGEPSVNMDLWLPKWGAR